MRFVTRRHVLDHAHKPLQCRNGFFGERRFWNGVDMDLLWIERRLKCKLFGKLWHCSY